MKIVFKATFLVQLLIIYIYYHMFQFSRYLLLCSLNNKYYWNVLLITNFSVIYHFSSDLLLEAYALKGITD